VSAVVSVAGLMFEPNYFRNLNKKVYDERLNYGIAARKKYEKFKTIDYLKNIDPKSTEVALPWAGSYQYYSKYAPKKWKNRTASMFWEPFLKFNVFEGSEAIEAPTLFIHSKKALFPSQVDRLQSTLLGEKKAV